MTLIRAATPADRDAAVALWQSCDLTRPWNDPDADFDRALGHDAATILLAEAGGAIAGTIMVGFDGHRGWVYYLGVHPDRRGSGIARDLLDAGCDWLRARGCPKVELMVRDGNPAAGLYERLDWNLQPVRVFARRLD
ncbi:acetyltransferase [Sphingopyxis terrae subsp. terrae NBRC 15098]|uniref:Acetyltransferase n=1 Tax=Sphingopyxis terrae subsp. terrae NBRC 15098 TaxID=1219058 RepID=A0A142W2B8_9SPHN|nr:GNAT family acetyltransferase [Sphingopyxis terrae]AMU95675.1 acetyltransferase [Sphingopyxis terrae subsp. terrae NBRC 15098]